MLTSMAATTFVSEIAAQIEERFQSRIYYQRM
jgi:hypothetical protein